MANLAVVGLGGTSWERGADGVGATIGTAALRPLVAGAEVEGRGAEPRGAGEGAFDGGLAGG